MAIASQPGSEGGGGSGSPGRLHRLGPFSEPVTGTAAQGFACTDRRDNWWATPLAQAIGLAFLGAYATWAAFQGTHFRYNLEGRTYLSPFYSPLIQLKWWPLSPALLILWAPLGFRTTCYYYRKAYYRAFFADPPACGVGEFRHGYQGESALPFILQNVHRYFLYIAILFLIVLWADVVRAFRIDGAFGAGIGSLVILANTSMLTLYTFSCHSLRHLVGGNVDCFSCATAGNARRNVWTAVGVLNGHHMAWAWWSLFTVCFSDFYVRMLSMGMIRDPRLF